MYGFSDELSRRKDCATAANAHEEAAAMCEAIKGTLNAFDRKVYNCRLGEALRDIWPDCSIYAKKSPYRIEIYTYLKDHRGHQMYNLASIRTEELIDGKRIPAEAFIESADNCRIHHLAQAAKLRTMADNGPEIEGRIKDLIRQANELIDALPYSVQEIYRLRHIYC